MSVLVKYRGPTFLVRTKRDVCISEILDERFWYGPSVRSVREVCTSEILDQRF